MTFENYNEKLKKYNEDLKLSENIDNICSQLLRELKNTDYKSMDSFKPLITPNENIKKILEFYEFYNSNLKEINKYKIKIEHSDIFNKTLSIKELDAIEILKLTDKIKISMKNLKEYSEIKIVKKNIQSSKAFFDRIVERIKTSVFKALERLPKIVKNISIYVDFILKNDKNKPFLLKYTEKVYNRLGFFGVDNNLNILIQQTSNLTKYFNFIIELNQEILGKKVAHNINVGLVNIIVINLKKVIVDALLKIEKNNKAENISLLIKLHKNLRHSKGPLVKEIESFFVFKDQINKLIINGLFQFYIDLDSIKEPNKDLNVEKENKTMIKILESFEENKEFKNEWTLKNGPGFGVFDPKNLNKHFSTKCLSKTLSLSEKLSGFEKNIYLINNKYAFRNLIDKFKDVPIKESIQKNCNLIKGLWKIHEGNYKGFELNKFLKKEIEKHSKYYLPENYRIEIQNSLNEDINKLIVKKILEGQIKFFKEGIEKIYSNNK